MGTFLRSLSIRTGDTDSVRARVVNWLSTKGYGLCADAPLFPVSEWEAFTERESDERGLFLLGNGK